MYTRGGQDSVRGCSIFAGINIRAIRVFKIYRRDTSQLNSVLSTSTYSLKIQPTFKMLSLKVATALACGLLMAVTTEAKPNFGMDADSNCKSI
jgi:hypothetical protein